MRLRPSVLLACLLLAGAASAVEVPPRGTISVNVITWECDPRTDPVSCVECDFDLPQPCHFGFGLSCVPNAVDVTWLQPSDIVDRCVPNQSDWPVQPPVPVPFLP